MTFFAPKSFFFFQAEDGIRDYKVTGVQTCALPISCNRKRATHCLSVRRAAVVERAGRSRRALPRGPAASRAGGGPRRAVRAPATCVADPRHGADPPVLARAAVDAESRCEVGHGQHAVNGPWPRAV